MSLQRKASPLFGQRGSALLAALCFAAVLGLSLASYLALTYQSLSISNRNMQGTRGIELAETGLEEALYSLNKSTWTGWTLSSGVARMTLSGFNYDSGVTGSVDLTVNSYDGSLGARTITAASTLTLADGTTVNRTLSTSATSAALFTNAVAATGTSGVVNISSGGGLIDSYNSTAGNYTAGTAGFSSIVTGASVKMTTAQIKGYVATPPNASGNVALSYASAAKLIGPTTPTTLKIDPARQSTSPYQNSFDVKTPTGAGTSISAPTGSLRIGTSGGTVETFYGTLDGSGNFDIENSGVLYVDGPVVLVIPGNFYVGAYYGGGSIVIGSGGSLQVFVGGYSYIAGNGITNTTKLAKNCAIFGTNTVSGYYCLFYTATPYYGVVYTPKSDVYLYGYGSTFSVYGSVAGRNVYAYPNSYFGVHYDTDLRNTTFSGIDTPYAVSNWTETTN